MRYVLVTATFPNGCVDEAMSRFFPLNTVEKYWLVSNPHL